MVNLEGNVIDEGTIKLDPAKDPKWIDVTSKKGDGAGKTRAGIYQLKGNRYRICWAEPGEPRPKAFTSEAGSNYTLQTGQKVKAKE
jgi:uncharacterized protein (TIGR03067 family)